MFSLAAGLLRLAGRPFSSGGCILCFHSIADRGTPSVGVAHVPPETLQAAIHAARSLGEIVPLSELARRYSRGQSTRGLTALTFDDAYASLMGVAGLLRAAGVPIAVFVASDAAQTGAPFWWDRVDEVAAQIPPARWRAFEDQCGLPEAYRRGQPLAYGPTRALRQWLLAEHYGRWPERLDPLLLTLEAESGVRTSQRSMTFAEIAEFCAGMPVELGVHTCSHPVLSLLPDAAVRSEIEECHAIVRDRLGACLPVLAVPYGLFDRRTGRIAREAGMTLSLSVEGTTMGRLTQADVLPRIAIGTAEPSWKLPLRIAGVASQFQRLRGRLETGYPPLPSATT